MVRPARSGSLDRPAAVLVDGGVDLGHQADGLGKRRDDPLVVLDIVIAELAPFPVLEPFRANLVAPDVECPDVLRNASENMGPRLWAGPCYLPDAETVVLLYV